MEQLRPGYSAPRRVLVEVEEAATSVLSRETH